MQDRNVHVLHETAYGVMVVSVVIVSETKYPCFAHGAAASLESFDDALAHAFREAELRLTLMLKNCKVRPIEPSDVKTVEDHARLYAYPEYLDHIRWMWEDAAVRTLRPTTGYDYVVHALRPVAVRLSPPDTALSVMRVLCEKLVPINFGFGNEYFSHQTIGSAVATEHLRFPHYFA